MQVWRFVLRKLPFSFLIFFLILLFFSEPPPQQQLLCDLHLHQCADAGISANSAPYTSYGMEVEKLWLTISTMICRPSLMGTHTGSQIADASLQARVLQTILENATAIFDED